MQTPELLRLHAGASATLLTVVSSFLPTELHRATPCSGWTVRVLLEHVIGQNLGFAAAAHRDVGATAFAPRPLSASPARDLAVAAATTTVTAFATSTADTVLLPELTTRRLPLPTAVSFHLLDTAVHGWDLAAAAGRPIRYDQDLALACLDIA